MDQVRIVTGRECECVFLTVVVRERVLGGEEEEGVMVIVRGMLEEDEEKAKDVWVLKRRRERKREKLNGDIDENWFLKGWMDM